MSELAEWDDWPAPAGAPHGEDVCACPGCDCVPEIDGLCGFCFACCVDHGAFDRQYEKALAGILAWRTHIVRDALEEEGLDAITWWPRVLAFGTLELAMRADEELRALDSACARAQRTPD